MMWAVCMCLFQISWGYISTKNRMKSDKDVTKIKRVTFFLRQSVVLRLLITNECGYLLS